MSYISFFDLLGTKGFVNGDFEYKENISYFYNEVSNISIVLEGYGRVGIFSDSVYVYSRDLDRMLQFLTQLRDSLCSEGLFFNAVVSKGEINFNNPNNDNDIVFGVEFTNKEIIDLYVAQTHFKGIGINISEDVKKDLENSKLFTSVNSFFYNYKINELIQYTDISYDINLTYNDKMKNFLTAIIKSVMKAYSMNEKYGIYYFSLFSTLLKSYCYNDIDWTWNKNNNSFDNLPEVFKLVLNIASGKYDECKNWFGMDFLCLIIIDMIISSNKFDENQLRNIIGILMKYPCLSQYTNKLDEIPNIFLSGNNRKKFYDCVQKYFAFDLVQKLIGEK